MQFKQYGTPALYRSVSAPQTTHFARAGGSVAMLKLIRGLELIQVWQTCFKCIWYH